MSKHWSLIFIMLKKKLNVVRILKGPFLICIFPNLPALFCFACYLEIKNISMFFENVHYFFFNISIGFFIQEMPRKIQKTMLKYSNTGPAYLPVWLY